MDHHETRRESGQARRTPLRAGGGRASFGPSNARVADAARAAADGLRGVRRIDVPRAGGSARAPGVGVLFDPVMPVSAPPTSRPADTTDPADPAELASPAGPMERSVHLPDTQLADASEDARPGEDRASGEPAEEERASGAPADVGVWNPFRQPRRPDPHRRAARPEVGNLHTRHTSTGVNVIATLVHRGRRCHGTAVGSSSSDGRLRAVAEATLAALQIVADEPLAVRVDRIRWVGHDPARVEIVVTWATRTGEEALIGTATAHDRADSGADSGDHAVMQATLDALGRRFDQFVQAAPQR